MPELVSVILPVYNCAPFLGECLSSIVAQSYREIEVVIVDDGSTDDSGQIADRYAAQDSRLRVLHQENAGPAVARNRGLEAISGNYVLLIDGDDWLDPHYVQRLVEPLGEYDLVVCGYNRVSGETSPRLLGKTGELTRAALYEHTLCTNGIAAGCWNKIFRRSLLEKGALEFRQGMPWGDDLLFLLQYYRACQSSYYINEPLYNYRLNPMSLMKAAYSTRIFKPEQARILDALQEAERWIDQGDAGEARAFAYRKVRSGLRLLFHLAVCAERDPRLLREIRGFVRSGYGTYLRSPHPRMLEKLAATVAAIWPQAAYGGGRLLAQLAPQRAAAYLD